MEFTIIYFFRGLINEVPAAAWAVIGTIIGSLVTSYVARKDRYNTFKKEQLAKLEDKALLIFQRMTPISDDLGRAFISMNLNRVPSSERSSREADEEIGGLIHLFFSELVSLHKEFSKCIYDCNVAIIKFSDARTDDERMEAKESMNGCYEAFAVKQNELFTRLVASVNRHKQMLEDTL